MSAPLDFLRTFARRLRMAGVPFAITSGMACVHYGLQQSTKDTDWIIPTHALDALRDALNSVEQSLPPWNVSYRPICGAPLHSDWMAHGWTSHLSIRDAASDAEHKVDIFSKPPRVRSDEMICDPDGWSSQHVVAQMKKTDRPRDWPIVHGLGQRLCSSGNPIGLLHLRELRALRAAWAATEPDIRGILMERRPLLRGLDSVPSEGQLERWLLLEQLIWERVNDQRYGRYTRAWKSFHRSWRMEDDWNWPTSEPFALQHRRLIDAARRHALPEDPLREIGRHGLVREAIRRLVEMGFPLAELESLCPPLEELLP